PTMRSTRLDLTVTATAPTELSTLSLHDALPILPGPGRAVHPAPRHVRGDPGGAHPRHGHRDRQPQAVAAGQAGRCAAEPGGRRRSEEHTSELQSRENLVCRLLLEKKNKRQKHTM